jgi:hypothetical protein
MRRVDSARINDGTIELVDLSASLQATIQAVGVVIPHTFAVGGDIVVPSGDTDYIPPFFVNVPSGKLVNLVSCRHRINSGTSATVKVQRNGVDVTGFTGISVTTTATTTNPADIAIANNDMIAIVVTAISGTPRSLSFTLFLEYI